MRWPAVRRVDVVALIVMTGIAVVAAVDARANTAAMAAALGVFGLLGSPALVLGLPFVLVQVAGEGFKWGGLPLAVTQASYALVLVRTFVASLPGLPRFNGPIDAAMGAFGLTLVAAVVVGVAGGADPGFIRNDLVPMVFLFLTYGCTRVLVRSDRALEQVVNVLLVGTVLAACKVVLLATQPIPVSWDGPWQAGRFPMGGMSRIILRGADVLFVASLLVVLARALAGRLSIGSLVAGLAAAGGVLFAGTRSNWVGALAGLTVMVVTSRLNAWLRLRPALATTVLLAAGLTAGLAVSTRAQDAVGRVGAALTERLWTVTFRMRESEGVLDVIKQRGALGNGLGSTFQFFNVERQASEEGQWSHNGYLMLLMKTGVVGLGTFLFLLARAVFMGLRLARRKTSWAPTVWGLAGGIVSVAVLSVAVNKIFALAGAMFLGLAFAAIQAMQVMATRAEE